MYLDLHTVHSLSHTSPEPNSENLMYVKTNNRPNNKNDLMILRMNHKFLKTLRLILAVLERLVTLMKKCYQPYFFQIIFSYKTAYSQLSWIELIIQIYCRVGIFI